MSRVFFHTARGRWFFTIEGEGGRRGPFASLAAAHRAWEAECTPPAPPPPPPPPPSKPVLALVLAKPAAALTAQLMGDPAPGRSALDKKERSP